VQHQVLPHPFELCYGGSGRNILYSLLYLVPKNLLSRITGWLAQIVLPGPLRKLSLRAFVRLAGINIEEASKPLEEYRSVADLFCRQLKANLRPISSELVSPADGTLRSIQNIHSGTVVQVKGINYTLEDLLLDQSLASYYQENSAALSFYLSPKDYHRVHAPLSGLIDRITHIPGALWPVNDWSLKNIAGLFVKNERVVIPIESESYGLVTLVMVGATNVGKISLTFEPKFYTNLASSRSVRTFKYQEKVQISVGDELGAFHLGSTVLLFINNFVPREQGGALDLSPSQPTKVGEDLLGLFKC